MNIFIPFKKDIFLHFVSGLQQRPLGHKKEKAVIARQEKEGEEDEGKRGWGGNLHKQESAKESGNSAKGSERSKRGGRRSHASLERG